MIIENIEKRIKLVTVISLAAITSSIVISVCVLNHSKDQIKESQEKVYVLMNNTLVSGKRTGFEKIKKLEFKSHIDNFHQLFFTITPDQEYIEHNIRKALYLIDESGIQEYKNLKEKGFYTQVLSASAVITLLTDSIYIDYDNNKFTFYGKQKIDKTTSSTVRSLITEGAIKSVPRSVNNPHGLLISSWRTTENKNLQKTSKSIL